MATNQNLDGSVDVLDETTGPVVVTQLDRIYAAKNAAKEEAAKQSKLLKEIERKAITAKAMVICECGQYRDRCYPCPKCEYLKSIPKQPEPNGAKLAVLIVLIMVGAFAAGMVSTSLALLAKRHQQSATQGN